MKITLVPSCLHARRAAGRAGMVVRCRNGIYDTYPKPDLPPTHTSEQLAVRAAWRAGVDAWGTLSAEQKNAWSTSPGRPSPSFPASLLNR